LSRDVAILVTPFSEPAAVWRAALRCQCPGVDVQCWPDVGDRSAIEFALVGALPHGELARLPRLALIASIFAGQDLLLADPELPPHVPIVRTDDRDGDPMIAERDEGIDRIMNEHRLDAIVVPMDHAAKFTGKAGYPAVTVPCGYAEDGAPVGISFIGRAWSEPKLIGIAHAFEQATRLRRAPRLPG